MLINGTVLHGRYRIIRQIGCGGMGAVYEALDSRLQNTVAVKECRLPGVDADRAFEREAKLLAALRHPALPVVIDYFVEGEAQFLVMQFIEGDDLGKLLDNRRYAFSTSRGRRLGADRARRAVLPARPGASRRSPGHQTHESEADAARRDCPSGLRARQGPAQRTPPCHRLTAACLATPSRTAPLEQILGRKTDARSDVYAVGATLYHLLTGHPPVNARDRSRAVASGTPDRLLAAHLVGADVPESLGR